MEDSLGVMWIGTSEGLVHYDGLWLNTLSAVGSVASDRSMIVEDVTGIVWSMNFAGQLFCSDFERMWIDTIITPLFTDLPIDIQQEGDSLLFLTRKELILYKTNERSVSVIHRCLESENIYGACGSRYVQSSRGIQRTETGDLIHTGDQPSYNICSTKSGDYCFFHITGRVVRLNGNMQEAVVENLQRTEGSFPRINRVRTTSAGTWILTYEGAYLVERKE